MKKILSLILLAGLGVLLFASWKPTETATNKENSELVDYQVQINSWVQQGDSKMQAQIRQEETQKADEKSVPTKDPIIPIEGLASAPNQ